jgi:hypothetical protein
MAIRAAFSKSNKSEAVEVTAELTASNTHPFEARGLGKAPFEFVGMAAQDLLYGKVILNRAEYERTGVAVTTKPGGTCAYCGTFILNMFNIKSSDGNKFHVGCECVNKTGDTKLIVAATAAKRVRDRKVRKARAVRVESNLEEILSNTDSRSKLSAVPHPNAGIAAKGKTLLDYAEWMLAHSRDSGKAKLMKIIKPVLA